MRHRVARNRKVELTDHEKRVPRDAEPLHFLIDREIAPLGPLFRGFREKREERIRFYRLPMPPFPREHIDPLFHPGIGRGALQHIDKAAVGCQTRHKAPRTFIAKRNREDGFRGVGVS